MRSKQSSDQSNLKSDWYLTLSKTLPLQEETQKRQTFAPSTKHVWTPLALTTNPPSGMASIPLVDCSIPRVFQIKIMGRLSSIQVGLPYFPFCLVLPCSIEIGMKFSKCFSVGQTSPDFGRVFSYLSALCWVTVSVIDLISLVLRYGRLGAYYSCTYLSLIDVPAVTCLSYFSPCYLIITFSFCPQLLGGRKFFCLFVFGKSVLRVRPIFFLLFPLYICKSKSVLRL